MPPNALVTALLSWVSALRSVKEIRTAWGAAPPRTGVAFHNAARPDRMRDKFQVRPVPVATVRLFIETHHYSRNINGCKVSMAFALYEGITLVGAVLFGPLSTTAWKRYGEKETDVVELRRLVCLDCCPKNTESWLIAKCLQELKKQTAYKICVSYADPYHGHCGLLDGTEGVVSFAIETRVEIGLIHNK